MCPSIDLFPCQFMDLLDRYDIHIAFVDYSGDSRWNMWKNTL